MSAVGLAIIAKNDLEASQKLLAQMIDNLFTLSQRIGGASDHFNRASMNIRQASYQVADNVDGGIGSELALQIQALDIKVHEIRRALEAVRKNVQGLGVGSIGAKEKTEAYINQLRRAG